VYGERTEQGLSEELAPGKTSFQVCLERAKNVLNLRILHSPLRNEFRIASRVTIRKRLL